MIKNRYAASEIAAMRLPGLPTKSTNIHERAKKEGWAYETAIGLGGARKMYEIPERYLAQPSQPSSQHYAEATQIANAHSDKNYIDHARLAEAMCFVDEWIAANKTNIQPMRKAEIVMFLYEYLEKHSDKEEVNKLLKLVG
ncbi:DNA-binding protein [Undibacterium sp.]|uniref:DNA-binding protein n=1 Tax=Undibacterium sp. TaxID=1914977 RepID=UPI0025E45D7D|nr:DNA-binding protein [Undibacterium sp.]